MSPDKSIYAKGPRKSSRGKTDEDHPVRTTPELRQRVEVADIVLLTVNVRGDIPRPSVFEFLYCAGGTLRMAWGLRDIFCLFSLSSMTDESHPRRELL